MVQCKKYIVDKTVNNRVIWICIISGAYRVAKIITHTTKKEEHDDGAQSDDQTGA